MLKIDKKHYRGINIYYIEYIKIKKNWWLWKQRVAKKIQRRLEWNQKQNQRNISECDYGKAFMKIEFNSDDDLPSDKPLKVHAMTILIKSVFEEDGKVYPHVFLDDALYELRI